MKDRIAAIRVLSTATLLLLSSHVFTVRAEDYTLARENMIKTQIESRGISDKRVLNAFFKVHRHLFVPNQLKDSAYEDRPLPIGMKQTISQPYIVAAMTELAQIDKKDKVLEIGTGSGYQAAILAELAQQVYSVEIIPELAERAEKTLVSLGYDNIKIRSGDGYEGWEENAPYDAIIITCAPPEIPGKLIDQLKIDGRMVVPVGTGFQKLQLLIKKEKGLQVKDIMAVSFVPMVHEKQ